MKLNTVEIIDKGLQCLFENLGAEDTEFFIYTLLKERFDYTKWRSLLVDSIDSFEKFDNFLMESEKIAVFKGNPKERVK